MLETILSTVSAMTLFWLVALIIFAAAEAATVGLVSIWFAGGALAALITAGLGGAIWLQLALFLVVSGVMLALLRPFVKRVILPHKTPTNADRHIGQIALVTEEINNLEETGAVRLDGITWTARAAGDEVIPVGSRIIIEKIVGVRVWVSPVEETANI